MPELSELFFSPYALTVWISPRSACSDEMSKSLILCQDELVKRKRAGQELDREPRISIIREFIEAELDRLGNASIMGNNYRNTDKLHEVFRWALSELW